MSSELSAEDVRIGNYVQLNNKELVVDYDAIGNMHRGNKGYYGIPVTADYFIKFGFEQFLNVPDDPELEALKEENIFDKLRIFFADDISFEPLPNKTGDQITNNVQMTFYDTLVDEDGVLGKQEGTKIILENLMVHELQNLWFSLKRVKL
jgi:hypothetical protein